MKKIANIVFYTVAIIVLSWFLPWLYRLMLPDVKSEPFMAYSPVANAWVKSVTNDDKTQEITLVDSDGKPVEGVLTKDDRDSLIPQMYYRNLMARKRMPDTIAGIETSVHNLKSGEMVLTSTPHDINKVTPEVFMIMESRPERSDFEDPEEVWRWTADGMEFIRIADGSINEDRSARFTKEMKNVGFVQPLHDFSANITSRKQRDDGYLLVDAEGQVFNMLQFAGRPMVVKVNLPEGVKADKVWILEATDPRHLGLMTDTEGNPYFIESDYSVEPLEIGKIDPRNERLTVMGNVWNIVFRITGPQGSRWRAIDATTLEPLGKYDYAYQESFLAKVGRYIFPYQLSFVSVNDSLAYPRIIDISWSAAILNILLALILALMGVKRHSPHFYYGAAITCFFGIFSFVPFILTCD
ncbi:MAG: DUF4857 domain-containing protein [Muribaculaceae bacterium]|nr:DUF4857 domain-containing protein [Muribaculaceae bacterium]